MAVTRSKTKGQRSGTEMPDWLKPKPLQDTKKSERKAEAMRIMKAMAKDKVPKSKLTAQGRRTVDLPCSGAIAPGSKPKAISVRHYRQERKGKMVTIKGHCRGVPGHSIAHRKKAERAPKKKATSQKGLSAELAAIRKRNEKQRKEAKKQEKSHKGIKAAKKAEKEGYKAGTRST